MKRVTGPKLLAASRALCTLTECADLDDLLHEQWSHDYDAAVELNGHATGLPDVVYSDALVRLALDLSRLLERFES
jgi:hypothetical protein